MKVITNGENIYCKTEREAIELLAFLHKKGYKWGSNTSLLGHTNWEKNKKNTCYTINNNQVLYGNLKWIEAERYKKITVKEFMNMNGVGKRSLRL